MRTASAGLCAGIAMRRQKGSKMSNNAHDKAALEAHFADIFASLTEQDIEQFYAHYQLWVLRRRLPLIEKQLDALHEPLADTHRLIEALRPSALALAVLLRLPSTGVSARVVLELMPGRADAPLDRLPPGSTSSANV